MDALGAEHTVLPTSHHGEVDSLDERGRPVIKGGVCHIEASEAGHHRLELEDRLQHALGNLGLVGRIGRDELRAGGKRLDDSGDLVVIRASTGKADQVAPARLVSGREVLEAPGHVRLAHRGREVQA